ncbi:hypothetical protein NUW58_g4537 [Xylaria curta]|uniref:Uncharacterized protein n=1 Tax=Xylaria curta TaxID=42375 RepID=A0ACC1P787_9PEZI|nr:hypothetical protein NUW58_g4537 [Xylaria curta]
MSLNSLPIIYVTGATACGKGTLAKLLCERFGFYHVSMGDVRRAHANTLKYGLIIDADVRQCVENDEVIPREILARYNPVPAVFYYHNYRVHGGKGWRTHLAAIMLNEEIDNAKAPGDREYKGILLDGHPLTGGQVSKELVEMYKEQFAGLTIVIESPRGVANQRYIERARLEVETQDRFDARMELTERSLPEFIELMRGQGDVVRSMNDASMSIEDAYDALLLELNKSSRWLALTQGDSDSAWRKRVRYV